MAEPVAPAAANTAAQGFFNPVDPFGGFTGWELQTDNPQDTATRAQALQADGDEMAFKQHDHKTTQSVTYVAKSDDAAIPVCGAIKSGWHIDTIAVSFTNTDFVKMTVTAHKHGNAEHDAGRTYSGTLTKITSKFGCPATIVGMTIPTGAGVRSMTYNLSCQHVDENDSVGEHLAGNNYDGVETVDVELCDVGTIVADSKNGWCLNTNGKNRGNTIAQTTSATAEHHVKHTAAA